MSDTFDPYHEWLGIPKQEQPASAYRLLGIREFEHDGAVIANAADRTMKHLRTYQAGRRSQISQKLLNEVANAKITLLDEKSKTQYDAELAVEFQASKKSLEETVTPPPQINKEPFVEDHTNAIESIAKGNQSSRGRRQRRGNKAATQSVQSRFLFIGFIAVFTILVLGIAFTVLPGPQRSTTSEKARLEAWRKAKARQPSANKKSINTAFEQNLKKFTRTEEVDKDAAKRKAKAKRKAEEEAQRKATEEAAKRKAERTIKVKYWPNGQKKSESHYKDGKLDGLKIWWYENGQKSEEGHWKNGKFDGLLTRWYENGQKKRESHYKNGELVSASVWKSDGKPCPETKIVNGSGIFVTWYLHGQKAEEIHYKDGKFDGLLTRWDENGQKFIEEHYKNGELDGPYNYWWYNGQKQSEFHYKNGEIDGSFTTWHTNGQKSEEGHYKNGERDGLVTVWYYNGQKMDERHYKNGKPDGRWTEWHEDGRKKIEEHFKDGNKTREILYKGGKVVSRKEF